MAGVVNREMAAVSVALHGIPSTARAQLDGSGKRRRYTYGNSIQLDVAERSDVDQISFDTGFNLTYLTLATVAPSLYSRQLV